MRTWWAASIAALALAACATHPPAPVPPSPSAPVEESDSRSTDEHCLYGCPRSAPRSNQRLDRALYSLSNNEETKLADWVAYVVTADLIGPEEDRNWQADPDLDEADTLEEEDYRGAYPSLGVDLGHQAPLASFTASEDWPETNYLSNITPQNSHLNRGRWARLEDAERQLAEAEDAPVYVITGPLFERTMTQLPNADEFHRVPSGYWKIVALEDGRAMGFIFENRREQGRFCAFEASISEIERRSSLNLFPSISLSTLSSLAEGLGC